MSTDLAAPMLQPFGASPAQESLEPLMGEQRQSLWPWVGNGSRGDTCDPVTVCNSRKPVSTFVPVGSVSAGALSEYVARQ